MSSELEQPAQPSQLSEVQAESQRLHAEWRAIIKRLIEEKPDRFTQMLCEGVLAELGSRQSWLDANLPGARNRHLTAATLVIRHLTGVSLPPRPQAAYISMANWIEKEFDSSHQVERHLFYPHFEKADSSRELIDIFFEPVIDALQIAVGSATQLVYHGVPLYEWEGETFKLANERSEEICYLRQRGSRFETVESPHVPEWATRYFFDSSHLKKYDVFFRSTWEQTVDEIEQLRTAYRHSLGIPLSPRSDEAPSHTYSRAGSRLLDLVRATRDRYYGDNFLASDANTWPRQKDVVAWLRETHDLSDREAQAVDIVCRPDALRGK